MSQFDRLHGELQEGGFSEHIPTATKPQPPGFMVSDFGTEQKIPSHLNTSQMMKAYAVDKGLTSAPPGENMGGWPEKGEDYLDVSRKYPDQSRGMVAMTFQNQKAMYDLSKPHDAPGAYISNPDFDADYTVEEHERRIASGGPIIPTWIRPSRESRIQLRSLGRPKLPGGPQ